jgi:hypothetical protein
MTEPPAPTPPDPASPQEVPVAEPLPQPPARSPLLGWLSAIGFVVLAGAIFWVWRYPAPATPDVRVEALAQQLTTLQNRVTQLEQRPSPAPVDLAPLAKRVAALEQRPAAPAATGSSPAPELAPLEARIAKLESDQTVEVQLAARVDALASRDDSLGTSMRAQQADVSRRLDADDARLTTLERNAGQIATLAERASRLGRIQVAQAALEAGQPLGDIPAAPSALSRFATTRPPTLAALRLAFPDAARAARAAAQPASPDKPLLARMWGEAQQLVTVREDGRVIVGDPAADVLERARVALDAGDLATAVAAVASLSGPPAQAISAWLADARALLDARAALAEMAAHV